MYHYTNQGVYINQNSNFFIRILFIINIVHHFKELCKSLPLSLVVSLNTKTKSFSYKQGLQR
jgi:hypothetical protein